MLSPLFSEAGLSAQPVFKLRFYALVGEPETLEAEFHRSTKECFTDLANLSGECRTISSRMECCDTPKGFDSEC